MNWKCIETDGMPNDRGYALPVQCFVCNPQTYWAGIATFDLYGWRDVFPSMDPRDGDITHWAEVELPPNLDIRWPRDWGRAVMVRDEWQCAWEGPLFLLGFEPGDKLPWITSNLGGWVYCRLATPEEAGDMKPLTVPEEVYHV